MNMKFAIAPCSWGIEIPDNPDNPPWETVLDEAGESGFSGIELGPYGYLPSDPAVLSGVLAGKGLELTAGTIYDDLTSAADPDYLRSKTRRICSLLSAVEGDGSSRFLVIIDDVKELRNHTAGRPELAKRLEGGEWKAMMRNIEEISKIASSGYGIRPVVHPHAGGYIEFRDETERFLSDISEDVTGLCLDTGHLYYAGDDPAGILAAFSSRLDYVHFKDINKNIYARALEERMGFFDACGMGVMCSIGKGAVDYSSVFTVLEDIAYKGWITIEQERDPKDSAGTLNDLKTSRKFLTEAVRKAK